MPTRELVAPRGYSTEDIDRAMWALALNAGSPQRAEEALTAMGHPICKQTLDRWKKDKHAQRYHEICKQASDSIAERVAAEAEQFMVRAAEVEMKALSVLEAQLDQGIVKDPASALRNITTAKALNNDKIASPLRGRPTSVHEHRTVDEDLRFLRSQNIIDGTATEIEAPQAHAVAAQS